MSLLKREMEEKRSSPGFLIDGFPRELEQAKMFEEQVGVTVCYVCTYIL